MKGIILAGGHGTRLYPITTVISKQLLPVYDKPMFYYPLSMLMLANIRDILVISDPIQIPIFKRLLGTGDQWGLNFSYAEQTKPKGIADALLIGKEFINKEPVSLILGDNIFFGNNLSVVLQSAAELRDGAIIFAYEVRDPNRYGIVEFDKLGNAISLEEKPSNPKSSYAVPGLYFYDSNVVNYAEQLTPSARGELEITDLNQIYLDKNKLNVELLGRGIAWLDAGTPDALLSASQFIQSIEIRQGLMISCLEEIALRKGFITKKQLKYHITTMGDNDYRDYLIKFIDEFEVDTH